MKDPNRYGFDKDFEAGRVCGGTANSFLDIDSACPLSTSARIAIGSGKEAITAPNNSVFGFVNLDPEDTQANKIYKEFMNAE